MNDSPGIKLGFSTLSLFMRPPETWANTAIKDGFSSVEILCEGPMWPRAGYWKPLKNLCSSGLEVYLHSPTVDLNPASVNKGIREETLRQLKESIDMAAGIGAMYVTTHPGIIHKPIPRVVDICTKFAMDILAEAGDHARKNGVTLSIENMPYKKTYLCKDPEELKSFQKHCKCGVTIDVGHAITCPLPSEFLKIPSISYLHVNDNDGTKDSHMCPGDGVLDLDMLKGQKRMIIELNDYGDVLRAKKVILGHLNGHSA
jgi:sugar phosphate isomerase/epimerase